MNAMENRKSTTGKVIVLLAALALVAVTNACAQGTGSDLSGAQAGQGLPGSQNGNDSPGAQAGQGLPQTQVRYDLLNTAITISIYEETDDRVFDDVFNRIFGIEQAMSTTLAHSEISTIAAMAGKTPVLLSDETYAVVKAAYDISVESDGAFNLAIGPLVKLWGINTASPRVPGLTEIEIAQNMSDFGDVILSDTEKSVFLTREGMSIDLGAIAKGYAGDAAAEIIRDHGISSALLDLGGNIVTIGCKPDGTGWRIGLRNPIIGESGYIGVLTVQDKAIVTSGGYERNFVSGGRFYHHIFDGKTGYPSESGLLSVTIISDSSTEADKLSTVAFVLGLDAGMDYLLRFYEDVDAVFITEGFEIYVTPGIKDSFVITDDRFSLAG